MERDNVYKIVTSGNYFFHGFDYPLLWRQYLTSEYGLIRKWVFYNGKLYSTAVHNGLDFANKRGTVIYASCDGIVRYAKYAQLYGNMVILDHGYSVFSEYYHMDAIAVKSGDIVRKGDIIGFMGSTGASTGSHLHWTVRINELIVNPRSLLDIYKILIP
jgi:murein DD-endopeptidase MepM/ murein hydrolase activator NlpD